jgi:hypothetical protein
MPGAGRRSILRGRLTRRRRGHHQAAPPATDRAADRARSSSFVRSFVVAPLRGAYPSPSLRSFRTAARGGCSTLRPSRRGGVRSETAPPCRVTRLSGYPAVVTLVAVEVVLWAGHGACVPLGVDPVVGLLVAADAPRVPASTPPATRPAATRPMALPRCRRAGGIGVSAEVSGGGVWSFMTFLLLSAGR